MPSSSSPHPATPSSTWSWLVRIWPRPTGPMPIPTLVLAILAGILGGFAVVGSWPGIGVLLLAILVLATTVPGGRATWRRWDVRLYGAAFLALTGVAAVRDAPWVVLLCLAGALFLGTLMVTGGRGWAALTTGWMAVLVGVGRVRSWLPPVHGLGRTGLAPVFRAALAAGFLMLVFLPLLASADAVFGRLLDALVPDLRLGLLPVRIVFLAVVTAGALGAAFVAAHPPDWDAAAQEFPVRSWRPGLGEWAAPLVLLNLLFLAFVAIQATALFGGRGYVERAAGLTYAEYAREGFGQLLVATVLTLLVAAVGAALAPRRTVVERRTTRTVLAALCLLCLLIAVSALSRLALYEQEFGFTRARLFAGLLEISLGVVLLLSAVAAVVGSWRWLPRAVAACVAIALLTLAAINPDAYVASHNVDRYLRTGKIDSAYLSGLSADAVPALRRLPEPLRRETLRCVYARLPVEEPWAAANVARSTARRHLAADGVLSDDQRRCRQF